MLSFGSVSGDGPRRLHLAVNEPQSCLFIYILFLLGGGRVVKSVSFAGLARAEAERAQRTQPCTPKSPADGDPKNFILEDAYGGKRPGEMTS